MSMISVQIAELRELADDIESRYGYPTAVKALRHAADTIWQLRDDLQRTNAENAKLRKLVAHYDSALSRLCDQMQAHVDCQGCVLGKDYDEDTCAIDELRDAARELWVEVDG